MIGGAAVEVVRLHRELLIPQRSGAGHRAMWGMAVEARVGETAFHRPNSVGSKIMGAELVSCKLSPRRGHSQQDEETKRAECINSHCPPPLSGLEEVENLKTSTRWLKESTT